MDNKKALTVKSLRELLAIAACLSYSSKSQISKKNRPEWLKCFPTLE